MRTNQRPRWLSAMLSLAILASAGLMALVSASPAQADPDCQERGAYVLWARGSGAEFWRESNSEPAETKAFHEHVFYALNAAGVTKHEWAELGNLNKDYDPQTRIRE